jgi:hypothetical protein
MATWHLEKLRSALEKRGWSCAESPGHEHGVSGSWELRRSSDERVLHIDFQGLDDLLTLPIHESYGCNVRGTGVGLYLRRKRTLELWQEEVPAFVEQLER